MVLKFDPLLSLSDECKIFVICLLTFKCSFLGFLIICLLYPRISNNYPRKSSNSSNTVCTSIGKSTQQGTNRVDIMSVLIAWYVRDCWPSYYFNTKIFRAWHISFIHFQIFEVRVFHFTIILNLGRIVYTCSNSVSNIYHIFAKRKAYKLHDIKILQAYTKIDTKCWHCKILMRY